MRVHSEQLMRVTSVLFYIFAVLFAYVQNATSLTGGAPGGAMLVYGALWAIYGSYVMLRYRANLPSGFYLFIALLAALAALNIMVSLSLKEGLLRWGVWFGMVIVLANVVYQFRAWQIRKLLVHLCYSCVLFVIISWLFHYGDFGRSTKMNQVIGGYSGAGLILAFAIRDFKIRLVIILGFIVSIFGTASKGALLFTAVATLPYILYWCKIRASSAVLWLVGLAPIVGVLGVLFAPSLVESFLASKSVKNGWSLSVTEVFEYSADQRKELFSAGVDLIEKKPLGYGIGDGYEKYLAYLNSGKPIHVHNGFLSTVIEAGVLAGGLLCFGFIGLIVLLLKSENPSGSNLKWIAASFLLFTILRNFSENYFMFSFFNLMSVVLLITLLVIMFHLSGRKYKKFYSH